MLQKMPCQFLIRRSNVFYFRLSVPRRFRKFFVNEFVVSVKTESYKQAVPVALALTSEAKSIFLHLVLNQPLNVDLD